MSKLQSLLGKLGRAAGDMLLTPIYFIACLMPRDKHLWIFGAWTGAKYLDNPKYIFAHMLRSGGPYRIYWIAKKPELAAEMRRQNLPVLKASSLRGIWCQLRARVAVFTHAAATEFIGCLVGGRVCRVQTWHGMPIKKIGYDDEKAAFGRMQDLFHQVLIPYRRNIYDLVLACSEEDKSKYITAFRVRPDAVKITGYARNDAIVQGNRVQHQAARRRIIYMPTLRGVAGSAFRLLGEAGFNFREADARLEKLNAELLIKLHPVQEFAPGDVEAMTATKHVRAVQNVGDIYEGLGAVDVLITDYSGIYFDFLITGKPIIMAPFDLADYMRNDRNLYYNYEEICPDRPCPTWAAVFERLESIFSGVATTSERYLLLQKRFHRYLDGQASKRAVEAISASACVS